MARRQRLDLHLLEQGLAVSRQQAQQLIRAGRVRSGERILDKPGTEVPPDLPLTVEQPPRFVSRGGEKLLAALEGLPIRVQGRVCLDGGISTGGFTDCLLQHGAERVYGIDVGYGQTAWSLRTDPRVRLLERTNLRHLTPEQLYGPDDPWPDLAVADVSFISLTRVLPALKALLRSDGPEAVLLVKPQFEVGRGRVGKGGVVRDALAHRDAIAGVIAAAAELGWQPRGLVGSPITGPAGNHEYLLWLTEPNAADAAARGQARSAGGEAANKPASEPSAPATEAPGADGPGDTAVEDTGEAADHNVLDQKRWAGTSGIERPTINADRIGGPTIDRDATETAAIERAAFDTAAIAATAIGTAAIEGTAASTAASGSTATDEPVIDSARIAAVVAQTLGPG